MTAGYEDPPFETLVAKAAIDCEANCLKKAIQEYLGRMPAAADFDKVTLYKTELNPTNYFLGIDGVIIGRVIYSGPDFSSFASSFAYTFYPVPPIGEKEFLGLMEEGRQV